TRDADRSTETTRHDRRGAIAGGRKDESMKTTQGATTTARSYAIDKAHSEVTFQVRHLLTKVRGRFSDFSGSIRFDEHQPEQSSVSLTFDAAAVDTTILAL